MSVSQRHDTFLLFTLHKRRGLPRRVGIDPHFGVTPDAVRESVYPTERKKEQTERRGSP